MGDLYHNLSAILPEIAYLIGMLVIFFYWLLFGNTKNILLVSSAVLIAQLYVLFFYSSTEYIFQGYIFEGHLYLGTHYFKALIILCALLSTWMSWYKTEDYAIRIEYHLLIQTMLLSASFLMMSNHYMALFVSIEMLSLASYLLTVISKKAWSLEAGLKYFVFGATTAGLMIYGISLMYGVSGSLFFEDVLSEQSTFHSSFHIYVILFLVYGGLLFKASLVPFHFWLPDVYQTAPTPIVALFSVVPKVAALALMYRWWAQVNVDEVFNIFILCYALLSLIIGHLSAISQKNIKRLIAYASIGQVGFICVIFTQPEQNVQILFFYLLTYALANYLVFYFVYFLEQTHSIDKTQNIGGLAKQYPLQTALLTIGLLSLIGLPMTGGFIAKFFVFGKVWTNLQAQSDGFLLIVFIVGICSVPVSLFYYLRLSYFMVFKPLKNELHTVGFKLIDMICLALAAVIIALFFFPISL